MIDLDDLTFIQDQILKHYDLVVSSIEIIKLKKTEKERGIYKIITPKVNYCLKKVYYSKYDLEFVLYLMEYLKKKGMALPEVIYTQSGEKYVNHQNALFFLMTWIDGKKCNYDNTKDIVLISDNLAQLHNHAVGFDFLPRTRDRYNYTNWFTQLNKKASKLLRIKSENDQNLSCISTNHQLSSIILSEYPMINQAINLLANVNFDFLLKRSLIDNTFCHLDYVNKNLYLNNETVYMIDFDRSKLDIPIHDLGNLLRRVMLRSNTNWNFPTARLIIDTYHKTRPLSLDELKCILSYLIFPEKLFKEARRYLKNPENEEYFKTRFKKIKKRYEGKEAFIEEFKIYYDLK